MAENQMSDGRESAGVGIMLGGGAREQAAYKPRWEI